MHKPANFCPIWRTESGAAVGFDPVRWPAGFPLPPGVRCVDAASLIELLSERTAAPLYADGAQRMLGLALRIIARRHLHPQRPAYRHHPERVGQWVAQIRNDLRVKKDISHIISHSKITEKWSLNLYPTTN